MKLDAKELRVSKPTKADLKKIKRRPIYIICDNVLDTYNIGSIFRLADAVGASGVYLCEGSETPPYHRIAKAAVGTEKWVPWKYFKKTNDAIVYLRKKFFIKSNNNSTLRHSELDSESVDPRFREDDRRGGIKIVAIEQHAKAKDFRKVNYELSTMNNKRAIAFVVGHETDGVSKEALKLCDEIVEIPMFGVNKSLNVMVSLAIVLFRVI